MQRKLILTVGSFAVLLLLVTGCEMPGRTQEPEATPPPVVIDTGNVVSAEAFIVPQRTVDLSFKLGGRIVEMNVTEGDTVQPGDLLARLDDTDLRAGVAAQEAALASAQARLAQTVAGATPEQIAQAEAGVAQAEAALARTVAGATDEDIAVAEAGLNVLRAQFNETAAATRSENLEAAAAELLQAEANQRLAQADFDAVSYSISITDDRPESIALVQANQALQAAQARFDALMNGATAEEVAISRAQVAEGEAALEQVKAGSTPEQIAAAQAAVLKAEAALATLLAGATPEQIAIREAEVRRAEVALEKARRNLEDAEIRAPFAGTITRVNLDESEYAMSGGIIFTLADLSAWLVETDDLTEIDVVDVAPGHSAEIVADALPEEIFPGTVTRIKPQAETKAGDVTYTVEIELDEPGASDPRLRWGLTVNADIAVE